MEGLGLPGDRIKVAGGDALSLTRQASERQDKRDRDQHFHQAGIVVVVHIGPVDCAAMA